KLHAVMPENVIRKVMSEFTGNIYQKPSIKSAVKRETRIRAIYYNELLEVEENNVLFRVGCEAGTYIRKLCHDMGMAMGTGAHMQELRRTKSGPFREDETLITLQDLQDAYIEWKENGNESVLRKVILPMEFGVSHLPKVVIRDNAVDAVCHGAGLAAPGVLSAESGIEKGDI
ncbi:MAG: RNA-guided pseudouridylation complex pseudouridine synthase subunit Cbf5, partial [Candidatus Methanoperedens sp.]|nr:RNA-guided pseudouridylation complex pseudouridine synthase subunit Cbf5 [Candidatus Methanoperedens sp.]